ncbi:hypothetical protein B2A_14409 [mine drainage metagenome]|uniref:Uncharacterized protein n=1 Tax=mine drainage metagenome TaxID=410659 RepID=T0ZM97_9ZZZZ
MRAAVRAGTSEPTARKYAHSGQMLSEVKGARRTWRTRLNPYVQVWPEIEEWLKLDGGLQAKTIGGPPVHSPFGLLGGQPPLQHSPVH